MPVINGVYLKDFAALPSAVVDANIIPIAISGNQIAYRTTVGGIVTDARVTSKLLTGLSVTGGAVVATDTILQAFGKVQNQINSKVSSVGLTMPAAFSVANSPITSAGTLAVTAIGAASQYIRGDGALADFPTSGGGGSSVAYYLNGSISQGTIGGNAYYEMNKTPVIGTGTDFTINANGYIAQFITDANDPSSLLIPAGNWNVEMYFSASSSGGTPSFYVEVYKYNGTTFTLLGSSATTPEGITNGTAIDIYYTSVGIPETVLTITDRLAIRVYVTHSGRTITLHTEDNHLSEIVTTFSNGLTALNGLTKQAQYFAVGSTGTDFNIASSVDTHTFNIPSASASNRGLITTGTQTIAGDKTFSVDTVVNGVNIGRGGGNIATNTANGNAALISNTTGADNTASGYQALYNNTIGGYNTAYGVQALYNNTIGLYNTASGYQALFSNTTGSTNTGNGIQALYYNTTGAGNTANGVQALYNNTTGLYNTANGYQALYYNTTGLYNTANGVQAGSANTTGSNNIFLGYNTDGQSATESNRTWIGNTDTTSTWVGGNLLLGTRTNATSDKLQVTGSAKITGQLSLGSTITNGTYTYTLPSATGTLALTSALSGYVPYTGATQTLAMGTNNGITLTDTSTNNSISITSSSTGTGAINVNKSGAGTGIRVDNNGTGFGFYANNSSTGSGIVIGNLSTGKGLYIDNGASATGDPFVYSLGGASFVKAKIDYLGNITGVAGTFTGALSGTSATFSDVVNLASAGNQTKLSWLGYNSAYTKITSDVGFDSTYNGTYITNNTNSAGNAQGNTLISSWQLSLGASDSFKISRSPSGSFTFANLFSIASTGAATFTGNVVLSASDSRFNGGDSVGRLIMSNSNTTTYIGLYGATHPTLPYVMSFVVNSASALSIASTGAAKFSANINAVTAFEFSNTNNTSGNGNLVSLLGANCNNTSSYHLIAATGGADKFYLYGNGTYTTVSDRRLKKNISTIQDTFLDKVLKLNIVNYQWNDQTDNDALELGMIAQEVEEIIPSIVHEGREDDNGNKYKGIQASVLPYILIKAIQELKAEIDLLKGEPIVPEDTTQIEPESEPIIPTDNNLE
jgi:hypothetical protein